MNFTSKQIWIFITSITFFATLIYIDFTFAKSNYLNSKNEELERHFNSFLSFRKNVSDLLIEDIINNPQTKELMNKVKTDPNNREKYRKELEELFTKKYEYLKSKGFDYFHFQDTKGNSFLRFQKTYKYDDSLIKDRVSISKIIKEKKSISGLETGTSVQKYRYIYPIFYENSYVGSVEISTSLSQLLKKLDFQLNENYLFITKKTIIDKMLNEDLKKEQYFDSLIDGYYINKEFDKNNFSDIDLKELGPSLSYKLQSDKSFSLMTINGFSTSTIYSFLPVKNINNEIEGYLISQEETNGINQLIRTQIFSFLSLSLLILGAISIYRHLQKRNDENKKIFEQYKTIMDQSVIVSKTDPKGIITYVNNQFCKISGYSKEELIGKSHNIIRHNDSTIPFFRQMWKTILAKKIWQGVIKNRSKDGKDYYVQSTIAPILNEKNEIIEFIALREDVTDFIVKKNIFKYEKNRINNLFNHINEILIIKKDDKFEQISQKFFNIFPFDNLQEFNLQHHYISELFISKEGYLENIKSDKWIQDAINTPNKINKALIKDKNGDLKTFWIKVQKVPYEKTYYYLFTLTDISLLLNDSNIKNNISDKNIVSSHKNLEEENKSKNINLFSKIKEDLKLPDEVIINLVDKFITSSEDSLIKMRDLIKDNKIEESKILVHNIKGSASTLRFQEISVIAALIESELEENNIENTLENIKKIEQLLNNIKDYRENK
ncbi:MAG: PAS domain S-box protein [Arcobacter sp.]|uniref:PAS domain S-box protein n=1 Tax=Arcobacter sp. TaxID=1872629 RepID=UPI003D115B13